mmetsp:Transcript_49450/g.78235  ORF Transcript_49450/g.78235 Transcript_49450/m.78235 type:complete len:235 (-) Transcript_49450:464-1168(-)
MRLFLQLVFFGIDCLKPLLRNFAFIFQSLREPLHLLLGCLELYLHLCEVGTLGRQCVGGSCVICLHRLLLNLSCGELAPQLRDKTLVLRAFHLQVLQLSSQIRDLCIEVQRRLLCIGMAFCQTTTKLCLSFSTCCHQVLLPLPVLCQLSARCLLRRLRRIDLAPERLDRLITFFAELGGAIGFGCLRSDVDAKLCNLTLCFGKPFTRCSQLLHDTRSLALSGTRACLSTLNSAF